MGAIALELSDLVSDFAARLKAADALRPQARSFLSGLAYQAGIGPHGENAAVALVVAQIRQLRPGVYDHADPIAYPDSRQKCDLGIGDPLQWAIEIKMARAFGDNGKLDDTYLKDLLSPYAQDRSALVDAVKLATSRLSCRKALLIYGFDYPERPLDPAIDALQTLLGHAVRIGRRHTSSFADLVHPVHRTGRVVAWEIQPSDQARVFT